MAIDRSLPPKPKVLIVDDDPQTLTSLSDLLRKECQVLITEDPEEALTLLATQEIALIFADQKMPKIVGSALLARAAKISPNTFRVLLTAYADAKAANEWQTYFYLGKPWDPEKLKELVRSATRHVDPSRKSPPPAK